jgi:hypothetical protein
MGYEVMEYSNTPKRKTLKYEDTKFFWKSFPRAFVVVFFSSGFSGLGVTWKGIRILKAKAREVRYGR